MMDLRELRGRVSELVEEVDSMRTEILIETSHGLVSIQSIYVNDNGDIVIEPE